MSSCSKSGHNFHTDPWARPLFYADTKKSKRSMFQVAAHEDSGGQRNRRRHSSPWIYHRLLQCMELETINVQHHTAGHYNTSIAISRFQRQQPLQKAPSPQSNLPWCEESIYPCQVLVACGLRWVRSYALRSRKKYIALGLAWRCPLHPQNLRGEDRK